VLPVLFVFLLTYLVLGGIIFRKCIQDFFILQGSLLLATVAINGGSAKAKLSNSAVSLYAAFHRKKNTNLLLLLGLNVTHAVSLPWIERNY
jgi:hypothetical protein